MTPALRGENIPRATGTHKRGPGHWRCLLDGCGIDGDGGWDALYHGHILGCHYRADALGVWRTT